MNFISIKDYMINLDNVIAIHPYDGNTSFHCVDDSRHVLPINMDEVKNAIDNMTNKNHRIRIDGLKGETLNVKVVNK